MTTPPKRRETVVLTYQGGEPLVVPPGWTVLMPYGNALTQVWPAEEAGTRRSREPTLGELRVGMDTYPPAAPGTVVNVSAGTPAAAREGLGSLAGLPSLEERVLRNIDAMVEERVADARARAEKAVALATALEKKAFAQVVELEIEVANLKKHYDTAIIERDETWADLAETKKHWDAATTKLMKIREAWRKFEDWACERDSSEGWGKFLGQMILMREVIK